MDHSLHCLQLSNTQLVRVSTKLPSSWTDLQLQGGWTPVHRYLQPLASLLHSSIYVPPFNQTGLPRWLRDKQSACQAGDWVQPLGWEDSLEKEMATHSSILAWRIPWIEEPGGLQSMGSRGIRLDWVTKHAHSWNQTTSCRKVGTVLCQLKACHPHSRLTCSRCSTKAR